MKYSILYFLSLLACAFSYVLCVSDPSLGLPYCEGQFEAYYVDEPHFNMSITIRHRQSFILGNGSVSCTSPSRHAKQCMQAYQDGKPVSGSATFCRSHPCSTSSCYCELGTMTEEAFSPSGELKTLKFDYIEPRLMRRGVQTDYEPNASCYINYEKPTLYITCSSINSRVVVVQKGLWMATYLFEDTTFTTVFPSAFYTRTEEVFVRLYTSDRLISEYTFLAVGHSFCQVSDCFLCIELWDTWDCMPQSIKTAIIIALVLFFLLTISFIPLAFTLLLWTIWLLFFPIKLTWVLIRFCWRCRLSKRIRTKVAEKGMQAVSFVKREASQEVELETAATSSPLEVQDLAEVERGELNMWRRLRDTVPISAVPPKFRPLLLILLLSVACNGQCTTGILVQGSAEICAETAPGIRSCNASFQTLITIPAPGAAFCLNLQGAGNVSYGQLTVTWTYERQYIALSYGYFTARWTAATQSHHRCWGAGPCDETHCGGSFVTDRSASGQLTSPDVINQPGQTRCRSSCGCATCGGCFYCDPSCVYSGYGIKPTGTPYFVRYFSFIIKRPRFTIKWSTQAGIATGILDLQSKPQTMGPFTIAYQGALSSTPPYWSHKAVVTDVPCTRAWFVNPAEPNVPTRNMIGDIQSNDPVELFTQTPSAFVYDTGLVTSISEQSYEDIYNFASTAADKFLLAPGSPGSLPVLPAVMNGEVWSYNCTEDGAALWTDAKSPGQAVLTINTASKLQAQVLLDVVCPVLGEVNGTGCYSCSGGSTLTIKARSMCKSGNVLLLTSPPMDATHTNLLLSTSEQIFLVRIFPTAAHVEFTLTLAFVPPIGPSRNASKLVIFTAVHEDLISTNTSPVTPINYDAQADNLEIHSFWEDFVAGDSSWWIYLLIALGVLAILFVLSVLLIPAIKWIIFKVTLGRVLKPSPLKAKNS